ncbi:HD domain-containing protein, partial [TM7 phylum sp. oral taxon 352]
MTDIAELNTGSGYNNPLEDLRECGSVDRWVDSDKPEHSRIREHLAKLAQRAIATSELFDQFARVDRIPRLSNGDRENDVEHSFLLATIATDLAQELRPDLDVNRIRQFSLVHDMLEIKTGDVATFSTSPEEQAEKERREKEALDELLAELPPLEAETLREYEKQDTPEARWTRYVDKMLATLVDITGQGVRVVEEDFGVTSLEKLCDEHGRLATKYHNMFGNEFPELDQLYALFSYLFEERYAQESQNDCKDNSPERPHQLKEVERKYLVDSENIPVDLENCQRAELKQGYLAISADGSETRIRSFGDGKRFELTVKSSGTVIRDEQNIKITEEMFDTLWPLTSGARVEKTRYYIPLVDEHGREY